MARIHLDHMDGRYSATPLDDDAVGEMVFDVEDDVYAAWLRHCDDAAAWHRLWRSMSNERYVELRAQELMPLEDAEREIRRLREELARAQRMAKHFESEACQMRSALYKRDGAPFQNRDEYTCVYPQPGCDIEQLPPEWRERAAEIVAEYQTDWETKYQGCCCGHTHKKLEPATAEMLRAAGFVVEHESEEAA